jgi:hypothetical protein
MVIALIVLAVSCAVAAVCTSALLFYHLFRVLTNLNQEAVGSKKYSVKFNLFIWFNPAYIINKQYILSSATKSVFAVRNYAAGLLVLASVTVGLVLLLNQLKT